MNDTIQELFNKKNQLMQQINLVDELIKTELDTTTIASDRNATAAQEPNTDLALDDSAGGMAAVSTVSSNPAYDRLNWRKKILHHLNEAQGRGMTTTDLTNALRSAHHGEWVKPSIGTTLFFMERDGVIRVDRSQGRNLHYLATGQTDRSTESA